MTILRGELVQRETREHLLAHLFVHQVHHRDARAEDLRELGWSEQSIWG